MARPRQVTDESILETTRSCLFDHGPGVSTAQIAERLGISHAVLFQRFGSKKNLFVAALAPTSVMTWLHEIEQGPLPAKDIRAQLEAIAEKIYAEIEGMVPHLAMLRSLGLTPQEVCGDPSNMPIMRARRAFASWLDRAIQQRMVRSCEVAHVADLFIGALQIRPFQQLVAGVRFKKTDRAAYLKTVVDVLWNTLNQKSRTRTQKPRISRR